jgi:hypothetical protein
MRRRVALVLLVVAWAAICLALFFLARPADAGMRKTIAWRHDSDELFVTSYARQPVEFRCRWEGPDGWVGRTRGFLDPGETKAAYTLFGRRAHAFDCWRVDKQGDGQGAHR